MSGIARGYNSSAFWESCLPAPFSLVGHILVIFYPHSFATWTFKLSFDRTRVTLPIPSHFHHSFLRTISVDAVGISLLAGHLLRGEEAWYWVQIPIGLTSTNCTNTQLYQYPFFGWVLVGSLESDPLDSKTRLHL